MAKTVDDLRNEIRVGVGRFEREVSADFTKEDLAAIAAAAGEAVGPKPLPPKAEMRSAIRRGIEGLDAAADADRSFRKAELEAIVDAVASEE